MPRNADRNRSKKRAPSQIPLRRRGKPKFCVFCRDRVTWVDYKDVNLLRRFLSDRAKIKARRVTGTCRRHQRDVATAVKTARELALLPYSLRTVADKVSGRGGRRSWGAAAGAPQDKRPSADAAGQEDQRLEVEPPEGTETPTASATAAEETGGWLAVAPDL